jgi:hypothetical protein
MVSQRRDADSRRLEPSAPWSAGMSWQPEAELLGVRVTVRGRRPSLRRRLAVSRWRASAVFGPTKRNGTPRLDSSESSRRTEVVARFHGDVNASPGGLVDELLGALRRICSSESNSSESGAGSGRQAFPRRFESGRTPSRRLLGARGSDDGRSRTSKRAPTCFGGPPPCPSGRGGRSARC